MSVAETSNPPGELYCTTCEKTFHTGETCPTDGKRLIKLKTRIDPFLGRSLDGRYTVLEKLGQGGMGAVYRAEQHSVDREVAIKVVNANLTTDPEVIKRFLREAKLASKLSHPNAVGVLDFNQTDDGVFYLVMELVAGRTLDNVIRADGVFRPERVVRIGSQILEALDGAHALKIVHRDLKPSNVMLLAQGRDLVKVLDFGLAKSVSPDQTSTTMTGAGMVVGTPAFMPPELATGAPCDGRADLYSLGVMLYLLGSGRLPFVSESVHELVSMHGSDEPAPPMTGVPPRLAAVIDKLLAKKPADRYQTASEALVDLEAALALHTPVPGSSRDTNPSLGPFPASSAQFAHLGTPEAPIVAPTVAPSPPKAERKKPSPTEVERMISGETMLAGSAGPATGTSQPTLEPAASATATSQPGLELAPPRRGARRIALAGGALAVVAVLAFVVLGGGSDKPTTTAPAGSDTTPPSSAGSVPAEPTLPPIAPDTPPEPSPTATAGSAEPVVTPTATAPAATVPAGKPAGRPSKPGKPGKPGTAATTKPAGAGSAAAPKLPIEKPTQGSGKPASLPF